MTPSSEIRRAAEAYLAANTSDTLYLLIDHAGMNGLACRLKKDAVNWASLFDTTPECGALAVAPILVLIGRNSSLEVSKSLIRWISEQSAKSSSVIMLASQLPLMELRDELTLRLNVKISQNMDAVLRFFDPRIFEQLIKLLTTEQLEKFCNPGRVWWYVNRNGQLVRIEKEFRYVRSDSYSLEFNEEQEFSLISASEPDQVMRILMKTMPDLESLMPVDRYGFIADNIRSASRLALCAISDFALYSAMKMLHGAEFDTLPYWRIAFDDIRSGRLSFADAVASSEDIDWES